MDNKKIIKKRILIHLIYALIGIALLAVSFMGIPKNNVVYIVGLTLILSSIIRIIRNVRIMSNPEYMKDLLTAEKDERNVMLFTRSRSLAFGVYIMAASIVYIALCFIPGMEFVAYTVAYSICALVFIYWVCYTVLNRRY